MARSLAILGVLVPAFALALASKPTEGSLSALKDKTPKRGGGDGDDDGGGDNLGFEDLFHGKPSHRRVRIRCGICAKKAIALVADVLSPPPYEQSGIVRLPPGWSLVVPFPYGYVKNDAESAWGTPQLWGKRDPQALRTLCQACFEWPGGSSWAPVPTKQTDEPDFIDWIAKEARGLLKREWKRMRNPKDREPLPWVEENQNALRGHQKAALGKLGNIQGTLHAAAVANGQTPAIDYRADDCSCPYCRAFSRAAPNALPNLGDDDDDDLDDDEDLDDDDDDDDEDG
jgi:hypothetical protein